jgi:hypothetical protein
MSLLGLAGGRRVGDWVNGQPVGPAQEHAMGFMQFLPSTWRVEAAAAPGRPQDPYRPLDAMMTAGSYAHRLETGAAGGVPHDLRGALAVYGGSLTYADQVLSLATPPAQMAGLPVVFPIPAPGWLQCVAGALATWAMMHSADPRWNHPPALLGNAIDLVRVARAERFQLDDHPTPGAMVVYGSSYGLFGHIATIVLAARRAHTAGRVAATGTRRSTGTLLESKRRARWTARSPRPGTRPTMIARCLWGEQVDIAAAGPRLPNPARRSPGCPRAPRT